MVPSIPAPARTPPVALRVSDLAASRAFFEELFGLQVAPEFPPTGTSVVLSSPVPGHRHFCIRLTTEAVPVRLSGVHVELETSNELLDLYFLALLAGFQTSELRFRRGSLATTIIDPDGHVVEVVAHHAAYFPAAGREQRSSPLGRSRAVPGRHASGGDCSSPREDAADRAGERQSTPRGLAR